MHRIDELRKQIEAVDEDIVDLIATRMEIVDEVIREYIACGKRWDKKKENEVIGRYMELCEEVSLSESEAKLIGELLMKISKGRKKQLNP